LYLTILPNASYGMFVNILGENKLYELKSSAQHDFLFTISDKCPDMVRKRDDQSVLHTHVLLYQGGNHNMEFLLRLQFSSNMGESTIDLRFMDENKNTTCLIITEHSRKTEPISYDLIIKDPSLIANVPSQHFLFYFGKVSLNHNTPLNLGIEYTKGANNPPSREAFTKLRYDIYCPSSIMKHTCELMYEQNYVIEFYPFPRQHDTVTHRLGLNSNLREPFKAYFNETKAELIYKIRNITTIDSGLQNFLNTTLDSPNKSNKCKDDRYGNYCYCDGRCVSCLDGFNHDFQKNILYCTSGSACQQWPLDQITFRSHPIMTEPFLGQILNTETGNFCFNNIFPKVRLNIERNSRVAESETEFNISIMIIDKNNLRINEYLNFKLSAKIYRLCSRNSNPNPSSKIIQSSNNQLKPYEKYNLDEVDSYELNLHESETLLSGFPADKYVIEFIPNFGDEVCPYNSNSTTNQSLSICPYMDEITRTIKCEPCKRFVQIMTLNEDMRRMKLHAMFRPVKSKNLNDLLTGYQLDDFFLLSAEFELKLSLPNATKNSAVPSKCATLFRAAKKESDYNKKHIIVAIIIAFIVIFAVVMLLISQKSYKNYSTTNIVVYLSIEISGSELEQLRMLTEAFFSELKLKLNHISYTMIDKSNHQEKSVNSCDKFDKAHFIVYVFDTDYEIDNTRPMRIGKKSYNDDYNLLMTTPIYNDKLICITFRDYISKVMRPRAGSSPSLSSTTTNSMGTSSSASSPRYMPIGTRTATSSGTASCNQSYTSEHKPSNAFEQRYNGCTFNMKHMKQIGEFVDYLLGGFENRDKPSKTKNLVQVLKNDLNPFDRYDRWGFTRDLKRTLERLEKEPIRVRMSNDSEHTEITMEMR